MTVSTTAASITLTGNGTVTSFAYNFEIPYQDDGVTPAVTVSTKTSGVTTVIASTLYTIFNVGNASGGTITYPLTGSPIGALTTITIARAKALTQPSAFPNSNLLPSDIEDALDIIVLEMQQLVATSGQVTGVSSVALSSGTTGLTVSGSPITTTGTFTLGGTLAIANGGNGTASPAIKAGSGIAVSGSWPTQTVALSGGGAGTVTSVSGDGGTTGLTLTGGPIVTTGTLTLGGVLAVANGGTGVTSSTGSTAVVLSNTPTLTTPVIFGAAKFSGATSGNVQMQAPAAPTSYTFTLPTDAGTNTYVLTTNGSGTTAWAPNGAGSGVTTISFGTTGLTPSGATAGAVTVAGTLATANGGTNLTSFTSGGAVYASSTTVLTTGTLPVTAGGTGATTLTGMLKGNATSAFTVGIAGTDYTAPGTATTWTAKQTFSGSSSVFGVALANAAETFYTSGSAPASTQVLYVNNGSFQYFTPNAANNFVVNLAFSSGTTLASALSIGQMTTVAMAVTQGGTAYYATSIQVDGTATGVTVIWQGGVAPTSGNVSGVDIYTFAIAKTGASTYTIFASLVKF